MNPEIIYTNYRDAALAEMFSAEEYETFVAMPFRDQFSYYPQDILTRVISRAVHQANATAETSLKKFGEPKTALNIPATANVITEDIIKKILFSHIFLADLTGGNAGVLLETGIAMAFKPNSQIILITQEPLENLHFDIRNNRVLSYNPDGNVDALRTAFLFATRSFEDDRKEYVTQVIEKMNIDAIRTIHWYASLYQNPDNEAGQPGLFAPGNMPPFFEGDYGTSQSLVMFKLALQELHDRRMLWTDYRAESDGAVERHTWAAHLTKLGWLVVQNKWPKLKPDLCKRIR